MTRLLSILTLAALAAPAAAAPDPKLARYAKQPLAFEDARGHHAQRAEFRAHGPGYTLWLAPMEAVFATRTSTLRMQVLDAKPASGRGEAKLAGVIRAYIGNDPSKWHTDATFGEVRYAGVYPGIDLVYHGNQRQLEYDFVVAPGASPARIALGFAGAKVQIAADGSLMVGDRRWTAPVAYQTIDGVRRPITSRYTASHGRIGFAIGAYDHHAPLVIDPTYAYSTYLGGDLNDHGYAITVDSSNNAYVTGYTYSTNFPDANSAAVAQDVFISKFSDTGAFLWTAILGGGGYDQGTAIAHDDSGFVYVTGDTSSDDFPVTRAAYDTTRNGNDDVFISKLDANGVLRASTYLGSTGNDHAHGIAVDGQGRPYVVGETESNAFPAKTGSADTSYNGGAWDVFVTRLLTDFTDLDYSTYLGGNGSDNGNGIVVDANNRAYVVGSTTSTNFPISTGATTPTGSDAFVTELKFDGSARLASRFVGGSDNDYGQAIAQGPSGQIYITGTTASTDFPSTNGSSLAGGTDAFVTKLTSDLTTTTYSMYLGGTGNDFGYGIVVNSAAGAWVTGLTTSSNFPTSGATQGTFGGVEDAFVVRVQPTGAGINFGTFLGGSGADIGWGIAVDASDNAYVVGQTSSTNFPTTSGASDTTANGDDDAFVTKYNK